MYKERHPARIILLSRKSQLHYPKHHFIESRTKTFDWTQSQLKLAQRKDAVC